MVCRVHPGHLTGVRVPFRRTRPAYDTTGRRFCHEQKTYPPDGSGPAPPPFRPSRRGLFCSRGRPAPRPRDRGLYAALCRAVQRRAPPLRRRAGPLPPGAGDAVPRRTVRGLAGLCLRLCPPPALPGKDRCGALRPRCGVPAVSAAGAVCRRGGAAAPRPGLDLRFPDR